MYIQWYYHKWGKTFLSDFQCWPKEGCNTSARSGWATGKDNEWLGKAQFSPFPFLFFPSFSVSFAHQSPRPHSWSCFRPFVLWASSASSVHPILNTNSQKLASRRWHIYYLTISRWPRAEAQFSSATPSTLRTCVRCRGAASSAGSSTEEEPSSRSFNCILIISPPPCSSVIRFLHSHCLLARRHL